MKNTPFICLSNKCDIIDLSDEIRSCPGKPVDRTLLLFSMSEQDAERLIEFCALPAKHKDDPLSSIINSEFISLKFQDYRYAAVTKSKATPNIITMYFFRDREEAANFSTLTEDFLINSGLCHMKSAFSGFSNHFINTCEISRLISATANELISKGMVSANNITVHSSDHSFVSSTAHGESINSFFLLSTFISLISVLNIVSTDREISINISTLANSFEISMSTLASEISLSTIGSFGHIMSIAPLIHGSYTDLLMASYCADKCGVRISADYSAEGVLNFKFCRMTELFPALEFKRPTQQEHIGSLISDIIGVILSVKKEQHKDKE